MLVILSGSIGRSVTGGQAWANLQYLLGLRALGHDAYYLEDVGDWSRTYDWEAGQHTDSLDYPAQYIRQSLQPHGFGDKWIYRAGGESRGMTIDQLHQLCREAQLLLLRGIPMIVWRPEYDLAQRRAFIDIDPGFTQIRLFHEEPAFVETLGRCEQLFTIGQRIGKPDCPIPTVGREWHKTVSPVAVEAWPTVPVSDHAPFSTIVRWRGFKDVTYRGVEYGQRDREFSKFIQLPKQTRQTLRVALTGGNAPRLAEHGWEVVDGWEASRTAETYRQFIQESRGEFCVAKHCYVETRGGWFSDRSVCYLASGRPVLVQDTGLADWLPTGEGVVTFKDPQDAVVQIDRINADYQAHQIAARCVAEQYFVTERILPCLLDQAMM